MICHAARRNHRAYAFGVFSLVMTASGFCFFFLFCVPRVGVLQRSSSWKFSFNLRLTEPPWLWGSQEANQNEILEGVLNRAAMRNRTVILTTLNKAWAAPGSIIDLFLESFRIGEQTSDLLNHLVIICLDQSSVERCESIHSHCFLLSTEGTDFSAEKLFGTPDYLKMMWRRIKFLRTVLELGFDFVFTDADIMWFRNPFHQFFPDADFQIACDKFNGNSSDVNNFVNGGFKYVKSNHRTIRFYEFWYNSGKFYPALHDQDVLDIIKKNSFTNEIGLKMKFLDTAYFGGFCEPSKDMNKVCTMHANCCIGLQNKLSDLRLTLDDWRNFTVQTTLERSRPPTWRAPKSCHM
ncbi:uncharacterized protein At4g15970-like [Nymphaea colorata]|nr:uncharacterized protein At4g15970-like [Nymphaea colorata]